MAKKKATTQEAKKVEPKLAAKKSDSATKEKASKKTVAGKKTSVKKAETEKPQEKPQKVSATKKISNKKNVEKVKEPVEIEVTQEVSVKNAPDKKSESKRGKAKKTTPTVEQTIDTNNNDVAEELVDEPVKATRSQIVKAVVKKKLDSTMIKGGVKLTVEKMEDLRKVLLEKLKEVEGDVPSLMAEGLGNANQNSNSPLHFAELGTDTFNQNFALGRLEREEILLGWVYEALDKMGNGKFGTCSECGDSLRLARLEFAPWVPNCVECQEKLESNFSD